MKTSLSLRIVLLALAWCGWTTSGRAQTPPVARSTDYNGAHSNVVYYTAQPWMNTNTTLLTVEAWIYCRDLVGNQALVARHYTTNLYFGLTGNKLRFYRSGGTFADSDGTVAAGRWTHVATTYDGTTARFYINGALAGTKGLANAGNNSTNRLSLGGQRDIQIAQKQAIAFMLAEMRTEIEAMRLLTWEAAWKLDQRREGASNEAYLASTGAADMAMMVTDRAVQILGGHGYIREHPVEMWMSNGRGFAMFTGLAIV